jgi:putative phosphoribosyl transferase
MYRNRVDAGHKLAKVLQEKFQNTEKIVVLAIPRGGVILGDIVACSLQAPLELIIPRKIGAPGNPELAIGALANDYVHINEDLIREINVSKEYIKAETDRQRAEMERRREVYLGAKKMLDISGKIAIIVDDGIATGSTALAAVKATKSKKPEKTVLATPVSSLGASRFLENEVDEFICLHIAPLFYAVGQFYEEFEQTTDREVSDILNKYR